MSSIDTENYQCYRSIVNKTPIHPYAVYTSKEAAVILSVKPITIQRYIRDGKLQATKFGKVYRITGQSLLDLMLLDSESVKLAQDRTRQIEMSTYIKSKSFLMSNSKGQDYIKMFDLTANLLLAYLNPDRNSEDENQLTIKFIGCRIFNTAMSAYRDALSGYYQVSFSNQRDLIEIQFLLDSFRTWPEKIKEWREADNKERLENFSAKPLRLLLDKRDGFTERKREERYKQFCEYASHVSYPGIKLIANSENKVEIGPFYDESKLMNTIHEVCLNFGYAVTSICPSLTLPNPEAASLAFQHMEMLDKLFSLKITQSAQFQKAKNNLEKLIRQLSDMRIIRVPDNK